MCHSIKTISRNTSGMLEYCEQCKVYQLHFNNIFIEFTKRELKKFKLFLSEINVEYWESKYDCRVKKRKIPIPTMQQNLVLMFNKHELESLKDLVLERTKDTHRKLSPLDIDYTLFLN